MTPEALVASLACWSGPVDPRPLSGGLTNTNFVVDDAGRRFVVRIGDDIPHHGISRQTERAASAAAAQAGVSPEVVHTAPGVLVIAFVEGTTLTAEDIRQPARLDALTGLIRRAHRDIPKYYRGAAPLFWVFHVIRDYGHTLVDLDSPHRPALADLIGRGEVLERAVGPIDLVFGHNDLLPANFLDDGRRLWLIDWDYAGFNSPLFDLGGLASNAEMPEPLQRRLIEGYFDRPLDDELVRRYAAMRAASLLRETMWSMVSERTSRIDFDYAAYTEDNLRRFEAAWSDFTRL